MSLKKICGFSFSLFFALSLCSDVFSEDSLTNEQLLTELRDLKEIIHKQNARIEELEKKVSLQQGKIESHTQIIEKEGLPDVSGRMKHELERLKNIGGLEIGAGITLVGQGTPGANNADATDSKDSRFDGSWSADIEVAKKFDDYGMAFILMQAGQGDALESELSVFSNVNYDAWSTGARVEIAEAWYEHYLFNKQFSITGGKIDATNYIDTNIFANDETTQFLGRIFGNSAVIDWPDDNAFGFRGYLAPEFIKFVELETIYMDERGDWENLFDNPFVATQLNFMPAKAFGYDEDMWGGNYRVLFWYNGAPHAKVKDTGVIERGNAGFGFSYDQKITDIYGVFGRFGWADPQKNDLAYDWSLGGQMIGRYWGRESDVAAIAIGQVIPGKPYYDVNEFHNTETHFEAYYSLKLNEHLTITPDTQVIWDPNGGGRGDHKDRDTIFVYGMRGQIDF